ncbi:MAG: outer membrane protein OmpA-like peptidoglycan-associated protein [Gammaproteobacteria bacterium]|jgi:outer membrane protein OmpA-like peptidoglycan-associated protein
MNAPLKQLQLIFFSLLISACTIPQRILPEPIPTFSHSIPNREIQTSAALQKYIQPAVVYFDNGSHEITADANKNLVEFIDQLTDRTWPSIVIEGHTDANNSEDYNLNLAMRRTRNVKKTLIRFGYPGYQMTEIAKGEVRPIASNATTSGRKLNRRVVIKLYQESEETNVMTALLKRRVILTPISDFQY